MNPSVVLWNMAKERGDKEKTARESGCIQEAVHHREIREGFLRFIEIINRDGSKEAARVARENLGADVDSVFPHCCLVQVLYTIEYLARPVQ